MFITSTCIGGKRDEDDNNDDVKTALREANEEIGLPVEQCEYITKLPWTYSKAGHRVTSIIASIPTPNFINTNTINKPNIASFMHDNMNNTFTPILSVDEVQSVFILPLHIFISNQYHTAQKMIWRNKPFILHYFNNVTDQYCTPESMNTRSNNNGNQHKQVERSFLTWGLTSYVLIETARICYARDPQFETIPRDDIIQLSQQSKSIDSSTTNDNKTNDSKL